MQEQGNFYRNRISRGGFLLLSVLFLGLLGCRDEAPAPDVSSIAVDPLFVRFDSLLFELNSSTDAEDFESIRSRYPAFTDLYVHRILGLKEKEDSLIHKKLVDISQAPAIQALRDSVYTEFKNIRSLKTAFRQAFRYYKYYFPRFAVPDVYFCFTEFAVGAFLFEQENGEDALGLSLDMFLGESFPYRLLAPQQTSFSDYLVRTFNSAHMLRKALEVLITDKTQGRKDDRLLDFMVDRGRTLYIIKQLVPSMPDSVLFEYTTDQWEWCRDNELAMWAHVLDKELLYERKMKLINSMVAPAPTTMGMPPDSPGRTADFLGFQIIDQYVTHTGISPSDLLNLPDAQSVLKQSRYKGRNID